MDGYRDYVRFLGSDFLDEIAGLFSAGQHIAILDPPNGGSFILMDELEWKCTGRKVVRLFWDDRMTPDSLLKYLSETLEVPVPYVDGLSYAVERMFREAASREPIGVLVFDVLGFPKQIARSILNALNACGKDAANIGDRLSAIVIGSSDFVHLTYGPDSPYNHAQKFVVYGLDKIWARAFFTRLLMLQRGEKAPNSILDVPPKDYVDDDGFDLLYEQTGGYAHFIQEVGLNVVRHSWKDGYPVLSGTWNHRNTQAALTRYREICMPSDYTVRGLIRSVEFRGEVFDQLWKLVGGGAYTDNRLEPHLLEVCGIARRDAAGRVEFASRLWRDFLHDSFGDREVADVLAWQERWVEVWAWYKRRVQKPHQDRPISGSSRFRLRSVVAAWRTSLMKEAQGGPHAVARHFLNGLQYFFGFDEGGVGYVREGSFKAFKSESLGPLTLQKGIGPLMGEPFHRSATAGYFLCENRHVLLSKSSKALPWPEETAPVLAIRKIGFENVIDSVEREEVVDDIDAFWNVYHIAHANEYEQRIGHIREGHRKALDAIVSEMAKGDRDFLAILKMTAEELVQEAGYFRVLISLVDPTECYLHAAASACAESALDFKHPLTHRIDAGALSKAPLDVHQWVVKNRLTIVIPAALSWKDEEISNNTDQALQLQIKAFAVTPMKLEEDRVIGTIHFERRDRSVPTEEEVYLIGFLSAQLAVFIAQKQREMLLEQALHAIDEPIRIIDPRLRCRFANLAAADYFNESIGWHKGTPKSCAYHSGAECVSAHLLFDGQSTATWHRIEPSHAEKWNVRAIDNFEFPFDIEKAARGPMGLVERVTDLRDLYELVQEFHAWIRADGVRQTAQAILGYYKKNMLPAGRIFLYKKVAGDVLLESFEEYGLKDGKHHDAFVQGQIALRKSVCHYSFMVLERTQDLAILEYRADQRDPIERAESVYGLPCFSVRDMLHEEELERGDERRWIEAPLTVGSQIVGKLVLRWPDDPERLKWGLLRTTVAMAGTALYEAIKTAEELSSERAKLDIARDVSYALRTRAASLDHFFFFLEKQLQGEHADLVAGMRKEIGFFKRAAIFTARHFDEGLAAGAGRIDLREIVKQVAAISHDSRLHFESPAEPIWIQANQNRIEDLILELVANARDFAPSERDGGRVDLGLTREDVFARLDVRDNGSGISPGFRPRLFEMFQCSPANRMGLGLSYVKRIAEGHGGTVAEIGCAGEGAHFVVRLPLANE